MKMNKKGGGKMREDNRGVTMIELIVMVAISMIFSGVMLTFVGNTARTYRYTSGGVYAQMESQQILDELKNRTMNAASYIYYATGEGNALAGDISSPLEKTKTFYIGSQDDSGSVFWQNITWNSQEKNLYLEDGGKKEILGKNISVFAVDISKAEKERLIDFSLTVEISGRKIEKKESITLRNDVSIKAP